jgi:hypothetical protein
VAIVVVLGIAAVFWQRGIAERAKTAEAQAKAAAAEATAEAVRTTQTVAVAERRKDPESKGGGARSPASTDIRPRLYTQCWTIEQWQQRVLPLKTRLQEGGVTVPPWEKVSNGPKSDELRYFHGEDLEQAKVIQVLLGSQIQVKLSYVRGFENSTGIRKGHFELWLAKPTG